MLSFHYDYIYVVFLTLQILIDYLCIGRDQDAGRFGSEKLEKVTRVPL